MMNAIRVARPMASLFAARSTPMVLPAVRSFAHIPQVQASAISSPLTPRLPVSTVAPMTAAVTQKPLNPVMSMQTRSMTSWRLRPYVAAGTMGALPLTTLSAGFSKVNLSLMVLPWKALPTALLVLPAAWILPTFMRFTFQNGFRHSTASFFTALLQFVLGFVPTTGAFENLFGELTFYCVALFSTFFLYQLFPEIILNDIMMMHFVAMFSVCLIPLAFTYMPLFASRAYFFL